MSTTLYLITPTQLREEAAATGLPLVHPLYRAGRGRLMRMGNGPLPTGGFLLLGGSIGGRSPQLLAQDILGECLARSYTGIFLDPQGPASPMLLSLIPLLEDMAIRRGWVFCITEAYGQHATRAGVVISSALSGGWLEGRITQAQETFGKQRVALALEPVCQDFSLPSPNGQGKALTPEELAALKTKLSPQVSFSPELCAHYFTYHSGRRGRLTLFDDQESFNKKQQIAESLGVRRFFAAYPQVAAFVQTG